MKKRNFLYITLITGMLLQGLGWTPQIINNKKERLQVRNPSSIEKLVGQKEKIDPLREHDYFLSQEEVRRYIERNGARHTLFSDKMIEAIIYNESAFNRFAESHKNAKGLMQFIEPTWKDYNPSYPFEEYYSHPIINIKAGIRYLKDLERTLKKINPNWDSLKIEDQREQVLAAYNWGPWNLEKNGFNLKRAPRETKKYIKRFNDYLN